MPFHQPSYLKGVCDGNVDVLRSVKSMGLGEQTQKRVSKVIYDIVQRNHERYQTIVDGEYETRKRAGLGDEPAAHEVAQAAWMLVQLVRQGCGDMHPDFQRQMRIVENAYGAKWGTCRKYNTASGDLEVVPVPEASA